MYQLMSGLGYMERKDILHRDIKVFFFCIFERQSIFVLARQLIGRPRDWTPEDRGPRKLKTVQWKSAKFYIHRYALLPGSGALPEI